MIDAATLADAVSALTDTYQHTEPISTRDRHGNRRLTHAYRTRRPSLLDQLRESVMPSRAADDAATGSHPAGSTPPARLDAIDTLLDIEQGAARWCWSTRVELREDAARNLRGLVGAAAHLDQDTLRALLDEVRSWTTRALIVCDWQTPPYRPHVPCPICRARGLRIRLEHRSACCVRCGSAWGPEQIVVLAEYVRSATGDEAA